MFLVHEAVMRGDSAMRNHRGGRYIDTRVSNALLINDFLIDGQAGVCYMSLCKGKYVLEATQR